MLKLGWYSNRNMTRHLAISLYVSKTTDYDFSNELELVQQIKRHNIDISGFKMPYHCRTVDKWLKIAEKKQEWNDKHYDSRPFDPHDGSSSVDPPMKIHENLTLKKHENTEQLSTGNNTKDIYLHC